MLLKTLVAVLLLQLCWGAEYDWCSLSCDGGQKHTMCVYKKGGGDSCKDVKKGLTAEEKEVILDFHNQLRAKVANGKETTGPQPSAADMNQLVWDDEVAEIAQRWVEQCQQSGGHDKCRITKDKVKVGQNYAESGGYGMAVDRKEQIKELVQSWYDEVKDMEPSLVGGIQFNGPVIGHYTQLVWGQTTHLGCGLAHKQEEEGGEFEIRLICNYKIAGNFIGEPVYTEGEPASKCTKKSTKYEGLCEPQSEGDKLESDASAPTSSSSDTSGAVSGSSTSSSTSSGSGKPSAFASAGFGKPSAFASAGFGKPSAYASAGFGKPLSFTSYGFPAGFGQFAPMSGTQGKPAIQQIMKFPSGLSSNSFKLPSSSGKGNPVYTFSSGPMSPADFQKMLASFGQQK